VECRWTSTNGGGSTVYDITQPRHLLVNGSIAYNPRVRNQITGFNLSGFRANSADGSVPVVGESCPTLAYLGATVSSVTRVSAYGGLSVDFGGNSVLLQ
jgi:hypothetical protein